MPVMNLPQLPVGPGSVDKCVSLYLNRLPADDALWPRASLLLTAYMAWPGDEPKRDSFVATYLARFIQNSAAETSRDMSAANVPTSQDWIAFENFGGLGAVAKPAFDHLSEEIAQLQRRWLLVADIFQLIVDMAFDDRIALRRGSSISKAIELCEIERTMPGHSQLRKAWSDFRDVAHLIAAGAHLAHEGIANATAAREASILKAVWIAPDAVLALAAGLQEFGLQPKAVRKESPILRHDKLWRVPPEHLPNKPFVVFRRLTEKQLEYLRTRRASKKYIGTTAPVRARR
jgi:hypothetical protein